MAVLFSARVVARGNVSYTASDGTAPTPVSIGETIDTTKCIIQFSAQQTSGTDAQQWLRHLWRAAFADGGTTIQFTRGSATFATDMTISWEVIEFTGCTVQHVLVDITSTDFTVDIDRDVDKSVCFISSSTTSPNSDGPYHLERRVTLQRPASQNQVRILSGYGQSTATTQAMLQLAIVEFPAAAISKLVHGTYTLSSASAEASDTLPATYTRARSLIFRTGGADTSAQSDNLARLNTRYRLGGATSDQLTFTRRATGTMRNVLIGYTVIEFVDGAASVQYLEATPGSGTSSTVAVSPSVDMSKAHVVQPWSGFNWNRSVTADNAQNAGSGMVRNWLTDVDEVSWGRQVGTDLGMTLGIQVVEWGEISDSSDESVLLPRAIWH